MALPPTFIASVLTIVPAMGAAAYVLRRYEGYFEQARLFFAIIIGMFAGIVLKALEEHLFQFEYPADLFRTASPTSNEYVFSFAYTAVGYAMLAAVMMMAILGFRKYRSRKDAPYYGTALGLAAGAMWSLNTIALYIKKAIEVDRFHLDATGLLTALELLLFSAGIVLAYGAAGAWIGKSSGDGNLRRGMFYGTLWLIPIMALFWIYKVLALGGMLPALAMAVVGVAMMAMAQNRVLDKIVPPEIREQLRKERRREQRRAS